jgi:hypothetical protein
MRRALPKTSLVEGFDEKTVSAYGLGYNPEETGTTIRNPSSSLFCVSSADRYKDIAARREFITTPFRFTITKNESLLNGFLSRIALTEIRFPWTLPNVSLAAGTNSITITQGAVTDTITIGDGFFTPVELAAQITTVWNALHAATPIAMTFLGGDGYFALTSSPPGAADVAIAPNAAITTGYKQLYDLMAWPSPSSTTPAATQFSGVTSLRWTDYIDIVCSQLTYNQDLKDTSSQKIVRDMLCRVYLDETMISDASYMNNLNTIVTTTDGTPSTITTPLVGYGGKQNGVRPFILYRQFQTPKYIKWSKIQPIGQVQFEIYDDQGRCLADFLPAEYTPSNDWNITMLASEQ